MQCDAICWELHQIMINQQLRLPKEDDVIWTSIYSSRFFFRSQNWIYIAQTI